MFRRNLEHLPKTLKQWKKLEHFLFEPHPVLKEVGARREARFIATLNFIFASLGLIGAVSIFFVDGLSRNVLVLSGLFVISLIAYGLARTPSHKTGSYLLVWTLVIMAFGASETARLTNSFYTNLILAFLIASITFPFRYMLIFVILNNVAIGLTPFFYPGFTEVGVVLGMFLPFSFLTLVAMRYRDSVENDRLLELKQSNLELLTLKDELEQRVNDRTAKLEQRAIQLQVVTEVARTAASFQDLDRLLTSSTRLISDSFGFYHTGIFLLDEDGQYVTLKAANSEGGQRMLARSHSLPIDLNSVVGYTAKTQAPRIAVDTGTDAVHFKNPDLPETRSEMAVPLKVGMRLIGILDVQSTEKDAFTDDDMVIMSTLGDQLALAMDNTRLLIETRRALVTAEQTYQRYFNQTWSQFSNRLNIPGYCYQDGKVMPLGEESEYDQVDVSPNSKLTIPLMVRGQNIGVLEVQPNLEKQVWDPGELSILEAAAERAALALESARLLYDAQKRAAKEQVIGEASSKLNAAINLESILQTALREVSRVLPGADVSIQVENNQVVESR